MRFEGSVHIARPIEDVFGMLADIQDWATGPDSPVEVMEKSPPGATVVGTRWREVVRLGPGMTMTMWTEVDALEPPRLLALRFWGGNMRGRLAYTLTGAGGHTLLDQHETLDAAGPLRPFGPLISLMLTRRLRGRLLEIRHQLEHGSNL
jgi:carbon monoxide dehydrogenase subunit G